MAPHPKGYPSRQSQPVDCSKLKEKSGTHAANVTILLVLSHGSVGVTPQKKWIDNISSTHMMMSKLCYTLTTWYRIWNECKFKFKGYSVLETHAHPFQWCFSGSCNILQSNSNLLKQVCEKSWSPLQPLILSSGRTSKHQVILLLKKSFTMDHEIEMLYMKPYQKIVSYRIKLDWFFANMYSLKQFLGLKDVELILEVLLSKHIHASFSAASVLDLGSAHHSLFPWPSLHLGSSQMVVPMSLVT